MYLRSSTKKCFLLLLAILAALFMTATIGSAGKAVYAAPSDWTEDLDSEVVITLKNKTDGMYVSWTEIEDAYKYRVYKLTDPDEGTWKRVKTINVSDEDSSTEYIDKYAKNGKEYTYVIETLDEEGNIIDVSAEASYYRLSTVKLEPIGRPIVGAFTLEAFGNSKIDGLELRYADNKSFNNYKTKIFEGTEGFEQTYEGFNLNTTYYFKVRAYKVVDEVKYYAAFSPVRSMNSGKTSKMYVKGDQAYLYQGPDLQEYSFKVIYNTRLDSYGTYKYVDGGKFLKVKYNNKVYYAFCPYGSVTLTSKRSTFTYKTTSSLQRSIVDYCMILYRRNTEYVHGATGSKNTNGNYCYDCSGFAAAVYNKVIGDSVMAFSVTSNLQRLGAMDYVFNKGLDNSLKVKTVCYQNLDIDSLKPGDLLLFRSVADAPESDTYNHCGIYLGNGEFMQCTSLWNRVCIGTLSGVYGERFYKALRFLPSANKIESLENTTGYAGSVISYGTVYNSMKLNLDKASVIDSVKYGDYIEVQFINNVYNMAYIKYFNISYEWVYETYYVDQFGIEVDITAEGFDPELTPVYERTRLVQQEVKFDKYGYVPLSCITYSNVQIGNEVVAEEE